MSRSARSGLSRPITACLSLLAGHETPQRIVALENPQYWLSHPSATFQGRDLLAPVAAHLASGVEPSELVAARDEIVMLDWPQPKKSGAA